MDEWWVIPAMILGCAAVAYVWMIAICYGLLVVATGAWRCEMGRAGQQNEMGRPE